MSRIGIVSRYLDCDQTYAALRLANLFQIAGYDVLWTLPDVGRSSQSLDLFWDTHVRRPTAVAIQEHADCRLQLHFEPITLPPAQGSESPHRILTYDSSADAAAVVVKPGHYSAFIPQETRTNDFALWDSLIVPASPAKPPRSQHRIVVRISKSAITYHEAIIPELLRTILFSERVSHCSVFFETSISRLLRRALAELRRQSNKLLTYGPSCIVSRLLLSSHDAVVYLTATPELGTIVADAIRSGKPVLVPDIPPFSSSVSVDVGMLLPVATHEVSGRAVSAPVPLTVAGTTEAFLGKINEYLSRCAFAEEADKIRSQFVTFWSAVADACC